MEIASAKLTATPSASGWAQVYEFTPDNVSQLETRGRLFVVIAQRENAEIEQVESLSLGRETVSKLHEAYFNDTTLTPFNALKRATERAIEGSSKLEIIACSVVNGVSYCTAFGGGEVSIFRSGSLATILQSRDGFPVVSASGYPKKGDLIVLGTLAFYTSIPREIIKDALLTGNPKEASEVMAPEVHKNEGGTIGSLIVGFGVGDFQEVFTKNVQEEAQIVAGETGKIVENISTKVSQISQVGSKKVFGFLKDFSKRLPQKNIYVNSPFEEEAASQNKKLTFSVAVILLVLLTVSIGFGVRQKNIKETRNKYQSVLLSVENDLKEAISLSSISPEKSRELFVASETKLKEIEGVGRNDPKIAELKNKIEESRASILGEYSSQADLFLDLSLLSSGFKGSALATTGGSIFILDSNGRRVVSVVIESKKSKVVAGPDVVGDAKAIAAYDDRVFVDSGDGIYEVGSSKEKVLEKNWDGEVLIAAFAGNIYLLDKSSSLIYRYAGQDGGFGEKQNWLSGDTQADFSSALSWSLDGAVYVLYPNSKILKYSLGSPQTFRVSGVVPEIGSIDAVYASEDNTYLYLLDSSGKRVVVTDKKGVYKAQYKSEEIGSANNLVVSEEEKKIILLTGEKLYSIELKHL